RAENGAGCYAPVYVRPTLHSWLHRVVYECQERNAGRVGAQYAAARADGLEAMPLEKVDFAIVPASLRPDGEQDSFVDALTHDRAHRPRGDRIGHEAKPAPEQAVQRVFDQHFEVPMD